MSFQNVYYKRATATSRACYVCSKPTTVCLATTNAIDFLYACEAHLTDTGFATELIDPGAAAAAGAKEAVSKEEIARIKAEWEAKEALKKDKDKDKDSKDKGSGKDAVGEAEMEEVGGKKGTKSPSPSATSPTAAGSGSGATTPTHKRYSLHRDFFAMRQAEHRRKRQTKQTQELAPRLPGAPRSFLG
jgi:hypothetical protein